MNECHGVDWNAMKGKAWGDVRYYWTCDCDCFLDGVSYGNTFSPTSCRVLPLVLGLGVAE